MVLFTKRITINGDDGYGNAGTFTAGATDTRLGHDGGQAYDSWYRFVNVTIPKGAKIDDAKITFEARNTESATTIRNNIHCEDSDDAVSPTNSSELTNLVRTTAFAVWDGEAGWTAGVTEDTPDIASPVQEVVDRGSWVSGNALMVIIDNDGSDSGALRRPKTLEDAGTNVEALLTINYTPNPSPTIVGTTLVVTATPAIKTYDSRFTLHAGKRVLSMYARPRNKGGEKEVWLNASPISMVEEEVIAFTVDWIGANKVESPVITVYKDEDDNNPITTSVFLSGDSHVVSGNQVVTLKKLTALGQDAGSSYVVTIQCGVDNNTEIRKLRINVVKNSDEFGQKKEKDVWVFESPIPITEGEAFTFSVDWLGASEASGTTVVVYKDDIDISSDVFVSGDDHLESGNVSILKKLTAKDGDGGERYVMAVKCTIDTNTEIRKCLFIVISKSAEG